MNKQYPSKTCAFPTFIIKDGHFRRKEDSKIVQRYRCKSCGTRFSNATFTDTRWQKRRRINFTLLKLLSSGVSMRRAAIFLGVDKKTVERKLPFLANRCRRFNQRDLEKLRGRVYNIQIDDLITKENSKLKPLSVSIAVDENRRFILGAEVSKIPAFGHLARLAIARYGHRRDEHFDGLNRLFKKISPIVNSEVIVKSDEHRRYPGFIFGYFPQAKHVTFKSEPACIAGQGELKKVKFDPLFTVNHTCATLRANVNRLFRRTWCTTKHQQRLKDHLDVFIYFHNNFIITKDLTPI